LEVRSGISCDSVNSMVLVGGENLKVLQKFVFKMEESEKLNCTGMKLMESEERKLK